MPKIYCLSCNKPSLYDSGKPKFCSFCGKPYINSITASPVETVNNIKPPLFSVSEEKQGDNQSNDNFNGDATYVPKIDKIECEFNVPNLRPNRQSGKEVLREGELGIGKDITPRNIPIKKTKMSKAEKQRQDELIKQSFKQDFFKNTRTGGSTEIGN
jgi:hypothetical protein